MPRAINRKPKKEPDRIYQIIGARIRENRLANNMSQVELAKMLNVTFQQVQKYEKGQNRLSLSQLLKISKKLKFNLGEFLESLKEKNIDGASNITTVKLIRYYNQLTQEDQKLIFTTMAVMADNTEGKN